MNLLVYFLANVIFFSKLSVALVPPKSFSISSRNTINDDTPTQVDIEKDDITGGYLQNKQFSLNRRSFLPILLGTTTLPAASVVAVDEPGMSTTAAVGVLPSTRNRLQKTLDGWNPSNIVSTDLGKSRIVEASELSPLSPGIPNPFFSSSSSENELYYPSFLFGSWNVTSTLKRKMYPYGPDLVPSNSLLQGSPRNRLEKVGDTTSYDLHFFSPISQNKKDEDSVIINIDDSLGTTSSSKKGNNNNNNNSNRVIGDRRYNSISVSKAYKQLTPVQEVDWDYIKDPTRLTIYFGSGLLSEDMMPLGQRRGEVYITTRQTSSSSSSYCAAERSRSILVAPGNVIVSDNEYITEYVQIDKDHVKAISRIAVYLTPNPNSREGVLWQQISGKAVAFFDYEMDMIRQQGGGVDGQSFCVEDPTGVKQCGVFR